MRFQEARTSRAGAEVQMANDADWVADVRRWYFSTSQTPVVKAAPDDSELDALGYEAAQPALEARHWPEARTGFADFK
jgi:hypothetical protein